jgi:hypothetical protein
MNIIIHAGTTPTSAWNRTYPEGVEQPASVVIGFGGEGGFGVERDDGRDFVFGFGRGD